MSVQVLVATMNQNDFSKVTEMKLQSDAIFANQGDTYSYDEKKFDFGTVKKVSTKTRGVGINRNISLMHADGEYLVISDDDVIFENNYCQIIEEAFNEIPDADAIIFNIYSLQGNVNRRINSKIRRIHKYNAFSYGAVRIVVKKDAIKRENIMFNTNFGGGTIYSCGEDTLFINDMLNKKMKVYTHPSYILSVDDNVDNSTWFKGLTEKYFYDKGALFKALSQSFSKLLCIRSLLKHREYREAGFSFKKAYLLMKSGIRGYEKLISYDEWNTVMR